MRWRKMPIIVVSFALLAAAGLVALGVEFPFRANRVLYLMNARRYAESLAEYERLQREQPRQARRLPERFPAMLIEHAASYYAQPFRRRSEAAAYRDFLDQAARRPDLLPLARRKRLDFQVQLDSKSSETLRAARDILEHQGYDPEALWWSVFNQYDPLRPLTIPGELLQYRDPFTRGTVTPHPAGDQAARLSYLNALLAVADRNWAEAAAALEDYRRTHPQAEALDLIHGLAGLKAGHPEAALPRLIQYRRNHPAERSVLRYVADAYLALGSYAWAGQALHEIRVTDPTQEAFVFQDTFGVAGADPLSQTCALLGRGRPGERNVALWAWLAAMAQTAAQRGAVDRAAAELAGAPGLSPADQALLLQEFLSRGREDQVQQLLSTPEPADTTATLRRQSMLRLSQWHPEQRSVTRLAQPPADRPRLTHSMTHAFKLTVPPGATLVAVRVRGIPAGNLWPIVHVGMGPHGAQTFYLVDSRDQARLLLVALRRPSASERQIEGAVSLINGGPEDSGAGRSITIEELRVF